MTPSNKARGNEKTYAITFITKTGFVSLQGTEYVLPT